MREVKMAFQPPYRPNGRSVWLGKDLARTQDWIFQLPAPAIDEIDANVRRLKGRTLASISSIAGAGSWKIQSCVLARSFRARPTFRSADRVVETPF